MRELGLAGARRGKKICTTMPGTDGHRTGDLLRRDFTAPAGHHSDAGSPRTPASRSPAT